MENVFLLAFTVPRAHQDEFKHFCAILHKLLNDKLLNGKLTLCSIVTGHFNTRCSRW